MATPRPGQGKHKGTENLKPVKKGDPPLNPTGRNQYTWLRESGINVLEEKILHGGNKKESLQLILEKLRYEFLVKGNVAAARELLDRVFGTPGQNIVVQSLVPNEEKVPLTDAEYAIAADALNLQIVKDGNDVVVIKGKNKNGS